MPTTGSLVPVRLQVMSGDLEVCDRTFGIQSKQRNSVSREAHLLIFDLAPREFVKPLAIIRVGI